MFFQLHHPMTMLIAGPSFSGKSTLVVGIINAGREIIDVNFKKIIWCFAEKNSVKSILPQINNAQREKIHFVNGVPDEFENPDNEPQLVILDDLMSESNSAKTVSELFTRGSHHKNFSVILVTQNIFQQSKHSRDISLNAKYIVHFKSPRDTLQFSYLARQIYPENSRDLCRLFKEITRTSHSYIFIDLTQDVHHLLKFRSDILNKDYTTVYCIPEQDNEVQYETLKGQQTYVIRAS